jgi:hypothetical protein
VQQQVLICFRGGTMASSANFCMPKHRDFGFSRDLEVADDVCVCRVGLWTSRVVGGRSGAWPGGEVTAFACASGGNGATTTTATATTLALL